METFKDLKPIRLVLSLKKIVIYLVHIFQKQIMKRTIRSVVMISWMLVMMWLPEKVVAQQDVTSVKCYTTKQLAKAKLRRDQYILTKANQIADSLFTVDSINKAKMQYGLVPQGSQLMQNQGGDVNVNVYTTPSGVYVSPNGASKDNFYVSKSTCINDSAIVPQQSYLRNTDPITLTVALAAGEGIGGDSRLTYGNAFLDYRGFYSSKPNIYHRGSLGYISGKTDSKTRFLIGLSGSIKLVEENVTAAAYVETGNINLGDSVVITTDVKGSFWNPQHYHMGLFTGMQTTIGEHFWVEGTINPMFRISKTGNFNFNCDLKLGYKLEKNIFFGGFSFFNQNPAFTVGSSLTF